MAVAQVGELEEVTEGAPDVVGAEGATAAAGEDRLGFVHAMESPAQDLGGELGNGDPSDRGLRLGSLLPQRALALALDDGAGHSNDHPGRAVVDVAGA